MHPQFVQNIKKQLGESESQALLEALTSDSPTSIRINPNKDYSKTFPLTEKVAWSSYGYYLEERPIFTLDPLFHAGTYYVQEASSMFVENSLFTKVFMQFKISISQPRLSIFLVYNSSLFFT